MIRSATTIRNNTPLTKFFCAKKHIDELLDILTSDSKISLRIIDWFVTNYSKKYNTTYPIVIKRPKGSDIRRQFMVYLDYKSQLKAFSKKQFSICDFLLLILY